jgi:O-succinylbenzoic acid--CoA ligase
MPDSLSIFAAARDAPATPALRIGARTFTFGELGELTRARLAALDLPTDGTPYPVVGSSSIDTVLALYALLERGVPALLLHARLTAHEREALLAAARAAGRVDAADAAAILYTSGTTGTPRAAVLTRAALRAAAQGSESNLGWQPDDCWLLCMPIAHVGGLSIITRCLAARRCVALAPGFDAAAFPGWIAQQRATLVSLVPTMLARVLDANPGWTCPPGLRAVLLGGAPASPVLLRRAAERRLPLVVCYGLTETCAQVSATPYERRHDPAALGVGRPLAGTELRIVDGHIEVRGHALMAGYWNEPPLPAGAWFATGDLGEIDAAGCLHIHARRTDLIVTGGENVYPVEVERALEAVPGIAAAGVFGLPDETWGQTVAAVLVAAGAPPTAAVLEHYIATHLAPHKRPRHACYVARLPQTPGGKLDRRGLPAHAPALRPLGRTAAAE